MIYFKEYEKLTEIEEKEILKSTDIEEFPKIGILHLDIGYKKIEIHSIFFKNRYLVIEW